MRTIWPKFESHRDRTGSLAMLLELNSSIRRILDHLVVTCDGLIVKTNKLEARADTSIISNVVRDAKHYFVRKTKFIINVECTLDISELLWPEREVNELIVFTFAAIVYQISLFHTPPHLQPSFLCDGSLLLRTKNRPCLILHKKVA